MPAIVSTSKVPSAGSGCRVGPRGDRGGLLDTSGLRNSERRHRFPEVDAAEEQTVGMRGVDGEVVITAPDVRAANGPADSGPLAFSTGRSLTAVGAAPDCEALV